MMKWLALAVGLLSFPASAQFAGPYVEGPAIHKKSIEVSCFSAKVLARVLKIKEFRMLFVTSRLEEKVTKLVFMNAESEMLIINLIDNGNEACILDFFGSPIYSPREFNLEALRRRDMRDE